MLIRGDCLVELFKMDSDSIDCCVTSPPYYGLRDYGVESQIGLEKSPQDYVAKLVEVFREVKRVLKPNGTLWLNLGDSYCGGGNNRGNKSVISTKQASNAGAIGQVAKYGIHKFKSEEIKPKDLFGIPWRVAFALQADGWYLRQDIIWHKPNPMPESVKDRCTKSHEYIFLLSKSPTYFFDSDAIKEPAKYPRGPGNKKAYKVPNSREGINANITDGLFAIGPKETRQKRSVWTITTKPFKGAHFATFPSDLIEPCILAGCAKGGIVLDPFFGSGTVGMVAKKHNRNWIGIELNQEYCEIAEKRCLIKN